MNLQLRQAREQIYKLVKMHGTGATERDQLRTQLTAAKSDAADDRRHATDIETKSTWELMAKNKHISELIPKLETATGISVRTGQPIR